jgi:hypothetical protein
MKKIILLPLLLLSFLMADAQKKGKSKSKDKENYEVTDSIPPAKTDSKKSKSKGKDKDKKDTPVSTNYDMPEASIDTATRFTGIIKYRITTDDAADNDSMFVVVGDNQLRIIMFIPGYRADQIFENHLIARFTDSSLLTIDSRNKTYKAEPFANRNAGTDISLAFYKKTGLILNFPCLEFSGEMTLQDGEVFKGGCLVSKKHSSTTIMDYNFLNIQPIIVGYKIVLAWRTTSTANENTMIKAYKIEPGNTDSYFDLSQYQQK